LAFKVLLIAGLSAGIGIAFFAPPFETPVATLVGMPFAVWLIRRSVST
jgi:hypothetical protein